MHTSDTAFDLAGTYVQLEDGPRAVRVEVGPDFWQTTDRRDDLGGGRLVMVARSGKDWDQWEMHPAGDEIVYLLSGGVDLVLESERGEQVVVLRPGTACIVPRGVWHRAIVHAPSETLHITRGAGTKHRNVDTRPGPSAR